jgi:hypothetical protein
MVEYIVFFDMLYMFYFILLIAERQVRIISAIVKNVCNLYRGASYYCRSLADTASFLMHQLANFPFNHWIRTLKRNQTIYIVSIIFTNLTEISL